MIIPFSKIIISSREQEAVFNVLRSGQLSQGKEVRKFEEEFAAFIGVKYAVAANSGTAALHLALYALNLKPSDEVITSCYSFIASANAILYVNAKPVFADIKEDFNIDVSEIEAKITPKTKAILPVHLFGNPCDMDKILYLAKKYRLAIIEDACQAHGAQYHNQKVGTFGKMACFSFYATKNMTTGEGGMITTNDKKLCDFLLKARSHGSNSKYHHDFPGFNYRMTEIQGALGRIQLEKLEKLNDRRTENACYYNEELQGINGLILPSIQTQKKHVFHHYAIRITKNFSYSRDEFAVILKQRGIETSVAYPLPIPKQKEFLRMGYKEKFPVADRISREILSLPIHSYLKKNELEYATETIKKNSIKKLS